MTRGGEDVERREEKDTLGDTRVVELGVATLPSDAGEWTKDRGAKGSLGEVDVERERVFEPVVEQSRNGERVKVKIGGKRERDRSTSDPPLDAGGEG